MGRRHRAALDLKQQLHTTSADCAGCGQRLGKHRYGDDACPNPNWRAGNGQAQWLTTSYREPGEIRLPQWPEVVS